MSLDQKARQQAAEVIETLRTAGFEAHALAAEAALQMAECDAEREQASPGDTEACWNAMNSIHRRFAGVVDPLTNSDVLALVEDSLEDIQVIRDCLDCVPLLLKHAALEIEQSLTVMARMMDRNDPTGEVCGRRGDVIHRCVEAIRCQ